MEDELNLEVDEEITRKDSRIKTLSDKVKTTSEERDTLAKAKAEAEAKAEAAQKDADFYKGFNTVSAKYAGANEYQDKIREKVMSGYDLEDAAISILAKEGKYQPQAPVEQKEVAAGGSAATGINSQAEKPLNQRSKAELRAELQELESKGEFKL